MGTDLLIEVTFADLFTLDPDIDCGELTVTTYNDLFIGVNNAYLFSWSITDEENWLTAITTQPGVTTPWPTQNIYYEVKFTRYDSLSERYETNFSNQPAFTITYAEAPVGLGSILEAPPVRLEAEKSITPYILDVDESSVVSLAFSSPLVTK